MPRPLQVHPVSHMNIALAHAWGWRACFYFLAALGGILVVSFLFFKDTFRRERSSLYQSAVRRRIIRVIPSAQSPSTREGAAGRSSSGSAENPENAQQAFRGIKLTASDLNPFPPMWLIMVRKNNLAIYSVSGA